MLSRYHLRSATSAVFILFMVSIVTPVVGAETVKLYGAGASFPAPLYLRWFRDYYLAHPEVRVDYQAIGSGGGRAGLIASRLDFAGSDVRMAPDEAKQVDGGVVQLPVTAGAIVLAYNLPGIKELRLSREALADIFLGNIRRWNDPVIAAANPDVPLPNEAITVVARGDASGTTYVTTMHLSAISDEFRKRIGVTMTPLWPAPLKEHGAIVRGQGNGGVTAFIQAIPGAIGYVQYAYAHLTNMSVAMLQNHEARFVPPNSATFRAALNSFKAQLDPVNLADPKGDNAYPIVTVTWLLARKHYPNAAQRDAFKDVLRYCLTEGQKVVEPLGYIPFSAQAAQRILDHIEEIQ